MYRSAGVLIERVHARNSREALKIDDCRSGVRILLARDRLAQLLSAKMSQFYCWHLVRDLRLLPLLHLPYFYLS